MSKYDKWQNAYLDLNWVKRSADFAQDYIGRRDMVNAMGALRQCQSDIRTAITRLSIRKVRKGKNGK